MLTCDGIASALVIAPHADDESVGAGGLLAKLADAGARINVLYLAVDGFHHYGFDGCTSLEERKAEIADVARLLRFDYRIIYEGLDLIERVDTLPRRDLVDYFEKTLNEFTPDLVLLPHGMDYDQDHVACYEAAWAATRPIPEALGKHLAKRVITYESPKLAWTPFPFQPTIYWDISAHIDTKLAAVAAYKTQLREPPHVRSLENLRALSALRGSEIGVAYAEAFHVMRWVP